MLHGMVVWSMAEALKDGEIQSRIHNAAATELFLKLLPSLETVASH